MELALDNPNRHLYFEILLKEHAACAKHSEEYGLSGSKPFNLEKIYDPLQDAIGCTYYRICQKYPDNQELIAFARDYQL